ncbi:BspA family leucine-rich repeat surface protein [Dyadobacter sp. OTU695]|uniref:BspA family leucine-rich repeat surface protein n=1 Tax=Dyadobacter sp. OTU695 TaxID=3043860 RepID=UPI00313E81EF
MANIYPTALFSALNQLLLLTFLFFIGSGKIESHAQIAASDYVTTWKTDIPGDATGSNQIKIPAFGEYTVYYESIPAGSAGTLPAAGTFIDQNVITLPAAGIYRIAIRPTGAAPFHRITAQTGSFQKLLTIEQWGNVVWSSMESAFTSCANLTAISATDVPVLSSVTTMERAFLGCLSLNDAPAMDNWDVGEVTDMAYMFSGAQLFNQPIGNWDVSSVTNMSLMFSATQAFNQPIGNWNVGNVADMSYMFWNASAFNQPIGSWNVSGVNNMEHMFDGANNFNQPIGSWDVSSVTDMTEMFIGAAAFNQPIGNWNVGNVTRMDAMFNAADVFNQPLADWDVSNVTSMGSMFAFNPVFNQPLADWDVSSVTNMGGMFGASAFNQPIGNWDVSNVTEMGGMFYANQVFNQPIGDWDVSSVTDMSSMFEGSAAFNQPIGNWDVSNVNNMISMFSSAAGFNQPIGNWNVSNVEYMINMFGFNPTFNQPIDTWDVSNVTEMSSMFENASAFNQPLGNWALNASVDMTGMLIGSGLDCSNYSNTLIGWAANPATPPGRVLEANGKTYGQTAELARDYLTTTKSWTITGDSLDATCTSMPVTLVSFAATRQESFSLLTWSTTEETNSDRFDIQRSTDGNAWQVVGSIPSTGESKVLKKYRFEDHSPATGINYYRLKMVDHDETFAYSHIERIDFKGLADFYVFPNPATDKLMIGNHEEVNEVSIYNQAGLKVLKRRSISAQGIDVSKLPPGSYTISVTLSDGRRHAGKVQVMK